MLKLIRYDKRNIKLEKSRLKLCAEGVCNINNKFNYWFN